MSESTGGYRGKRLFDLVVLALAAIPSCIVGAAVAAAIRLTSPGPAVLHIPRIGQGGRRFRMLKFRTSVDPADEHPPLDDPRTTPVGRWVRRLSLDELPQLLNVARGEMSFVGPRPTGDERTERYSEDQWRRVAVRPGITGLAQVGGRNHLDWQDRLAADLEYVDAQSPTTDLRLLAATLSAAVTGHGAELIDHDDAVDYWVAPSERDEA